MKIDLNDKVDKAGEFVRSAIGRAVLNLIPKKVLEETFGEGGSRVLDVQMTINGITVNPKIFFDLVEQGVDDAVKNEAVKLVEDKFEEMRDLTNSVYDLLEQGRSELRRVLSQKLGMYWIDND